MSTKRRIRILKEQLRFLEGLPDDPKTEKQQRKVIDELATLEQDKKKYRHSKNLQGYSLPKASHGSLRENHSERQ